MFLFIPFVLANQTFFKLKIPNVAIVVNTKNNKCKNSPLISFCLKYIIVMISFSCQQTLFVSEELKIIPTPGFMFFRYISSKYLNETHLSSLHIILFIYLPTTINQGNNNSLTVDYSIVFQFILESYISSKWC